MLDPDTAFVFSLVGYCRRKNTMLKNVDDILISNYIESLV